MLERVILRLIGIHPWVDAFPLADFLSGPDQQKMEGLLDSHMLLRYTNFTISEWKKFSILNPFKFLICK